MNAPTRVLALLVLLVTGVAGTTLAPGASAASASTTTHASARTPIEQDVTISSGGRKRSYLLVRPAGPTSGLPMLVFLHGVSTTPKGELQRDGLLPLAANGQAVLVYPAGYRGSWNTRDKCCQAAAAANIDDVTFIHDVVNDVLAKEHTKPSRTYLAGFSNGAKLVWTIACLAPKGFRAYAEFGGNPDPCPNRVKAPFLLGAGGVDGTEPILGKATDDRGPHPALKPGLDSMLTRNGCHGAGSATIVDTALITSWTGCAKAPVTYIDWRTSLHYWPSPPVTGSADSAATLIWNFLSAQR